MKHALILNLVIAACVVIGMLITQRAEPLFALFTLRDMPFGLLVGHTAQDDDEPSIGFTAPI